MTKSNKIFNRAALAALLFCSAIGTARLQGQDQSISYAAGNNYDAYKMLYDLYSDDASVDPLNLYDMEDFDKLSDEEKELIILNLSHLLITL